MSHFVHCLSIAFFNYHMLKPHAVEILLEAVQVPSACVVRSVLFIVGKVGIGNQSHL